MVIIADLVAGIQVILLPRLVVEPERQHAVVLPLADAAEDLVARDVAVCWPRARRQQTPLHAVQEEVGAVAPDLAETEAREGFVAERAVAVQADSEAVQVRGLGRPEFRVRERRLEAPRAGVERPIVRLVREPDLAELWNAAEGQHGRLPVQHGAFDFEGGCVRQCARTLNHRSRHAYGHFSYGSDDRETGILQMKRFVRIEVDRQERAAVVVESADRGDRVRDLVRALREVFDRAPVAAAQVERVTAARPHEIRDIEFKRRPSVELAPSELAVEVDFWGIPCAAQVQDDAFALPGRRDLDLATEPQEIRHILSYGALPARHLVILPRGRRIGTFSGGADLMLPDAAQVEAVAGFGFRVDGTIGG